jgi:hypothetical protein
MLAATRSKKAEEVVRIIVRAFARANTSRINQKYVAQTAGVSLSNVNAIIFKLKESGVLREVLNEENGNHYCPGKYAKTYQLSSELELCLEAQVDRSKSQAACLDGPPKDGEWDSYAFASLRLFSSPEEYLEHARSLPGIDDKKDRLGMFERKAKWKIRKDGGTWRATGTKTA